jgi:hypothetical protein
MCMLKWTSFYIPYAACVRDSHHQPFPDEPILHDSTSSIPRLINSFIIDDPCFFCLSYSSAIYVLSMNLALPIKLFAADNLEQPLISNPFC